MLSRWRAVCSWFVLLPAHIIAQSGNDVPSESDVCTVGGQCAGKTPEVASNIPETEAKLLEWVRTQGGTMSGVEMRWSSETERSLVASKDLPKGTEVLKFPLDLVIDTRRAANTALGQSLLRAAKKNSTIARDLDGLLLASWLMHEAASENSTWAPYLASLPQWFPSMPLNFTEEDSRLCLEGLPIEDGHKRRRALLDQELEFLQNIAGADMITQERYLWARAMSFSRTFTVSRMLLGLDLMQAGGPRQRLPQVEFYGSAAEDTEGKATKDEASVFVPFADMINHARGKSVNCLWEYKSQQGFIVTTKRPLAAGEELFITYGNKGNDVFLSYYGFVEAGNPFDTLDMVLSIPASTDSTGDGDDVDGDALARIREDGKIALRLDGAKPANVGVLKMILGAARAHAQKQLQTSAEAGVASIEKLALKTLHQEFERESRVYQQQPGCPSVCIAFRENRRELLGTWRRFLEAAIAFLEGRRVSEGQALSERFELHVRLYFGLWLGSIGKQLLVTDHLSEATDFGSASYMDLFDLDHDDD